MDLAGAQILVTGASRGLGRHIAAALHEKGAQLHLVARSQADLDQVAATLSGSRTYALDLADRSALEPLAHLPIDVLVNNAGIETVAYFHDLPMDEIDRMLDVNLRAALALTRTLLPGMVERKRGHVVNIASLAGKSGPPLAETYAVTKAGLVAFTQSLRASYAGTGVSASVICPGYVRGEGMFADRVARSAGAPPKIIGSSPPEAVSGAVVRAIVRDEPELFVTPTPARLFAALGALQPRFPGWLLRKLDLRSLYEAQRHDRDLA